MLITLILAGLLGLIVGSFLNVVITRYPQMLQQQWRTECYTFLKQTPDNCKPAPNLLTPRSHCPHCQQPLKMWHNIPLLSFFLLGGRCGFCHKAIAWTYPIVEALCTVLTVLVVMKFGTNWHSAALIIFTWSILALSVIDFQQHILPDTITLPLLWLGLLLNALNFFTTPIQAILGAVIGYGLLWLVAKLFLLIRKKEGMGYGDFKMLAMLGAWFGINTLSNILLTAVFSALFVSLIALLCKKISADKPIPFGPFLAIGGWLTIMLGPFFTNFIYRILT